MWIIFSRVTRVYQHKTSVLAIRMQHVHNRGERQYWLHQQLCTKTRFNSYCC